MLVHNDLIGNCHCRSVFANDKAVSTACRPYEGAQVAAPKELAGVQEGIEVVGDVLVVQGGGVRVVAKRGGGVAMAEAGLRLEELALIDELGGHAVAEAVKGGLVDACGSAETGQAVAQGVGAQMCAPLRPRREEPVVHSGRGAGCASRCQVLR
jgi:hypothetical protein